MFNSILTSPITLTQFLVCMIASLVLGVLAAVVFTYKNSHSGSLAVALALLPCVVAMVIMMVNGNVGAGLAVAGTFALVRFRSAPGTAREITGLFFSVALGLACGMGFVGLAAAFFAIFALALLILTATNFCQRGGIRTLKITIPENLDYDGLFDDLFAEYTRSHELVRVRTTNMGTLYELTYHVCFKSGDVTKEFIDAVRCRNGNLNIICSREYDRELI